MGRNDEVGVAIDSFLIGVLLSSLVFIAVYNVFVCNNYVSTQEALKNRAIRAEVDMEGKVIFVWNSTNVVHKPRLAGEYKASNEAVFSNVKKAVEAGND